MCAVSQLLSQNEIERFSRHLLIPEVGLAGQKKLKGSRVLLVGLGGLGSPAAYYLAASGIGTLGIVENDRIEAANLHRQILYSVSDIGKLKVDAAREKLSRMNEFMEIKIYPERLTSRNALKILEPYDIIIDGTDNFPTRYLVNDAGVFLKKPTVYGSVYRFEGRAALFYAERGPCYRCLYDEIPPANVFSNCAESGVFGILPGVIGMIQATEAIKWIMGIGESLLGRLLIYDALKMSFREMQIAKNERCAICGIHPVRTSLKDDETTCRVTPESDNVPEITPQDLIKEMADNKNLLLIDVREEEEWNSGHLKKARHIPLAA